MDKYSTPEERLLNLIRRKDKKASQPVEKELVPATAVSRPEFFNLKKILAKSQPLSFKFWNGALIIIAAALVIYLIFEFLFFKGEVRVRTKPNLKMPEAEKGMLSAEPQPKPYSYYAGQFEGRDIFDISQAAENPERPIEVNANLQQLARNLKLVGVILDNEPQAIIESATDNKTYFLHRGETIDNLRIEEITESKVILSYGKEKLELGL